MTRIERVAVGTSLAVALVLLAAVGAKLLQERISREQSEEAYIIVPEGMAMANFRYQDIPMKECEWCHRKVDLNRHHIQSWASAPELKDDPGNISVLCRACHFTIGHGCNWKRFNANLRQTLATQDWRDSNETYRQTHGGNERTETRR